MTTLGYISDTSFQSINHGASRADDTDGIVFLNNVTYYKSVWYKSEFNFSGKFTQWHFSVSSDIFHRLYGLYKP